MLYDTTDGLINQQFYENGTDRIFGRTTDISIKLKHSGKVIKKFKDLFNNNIELFIEGKYFEFLSKFKIIKGLNNDDLIKNLEKKLLEKIESLKGADIDMIVLYTIVVSELISKIRDLNFKEVLKEIKNRAQIKTNLSLDEIENALNLMFMKNNDLVSILYNLSYLDALAESFNFKKVARNCKILKSKYINKIIKKIKEFN
ncbi:MAG: hypothetical protein ACTSVV_18880 [Promethearchaeota archaeon]